MCVYTFEWLYSLKKTVPRIISRYLFFSLCVSLAQKCVKTSLINLRPLKLYTSHSIQSLRAVFTIDAWGTFKFPKIKKFIGRIEDQKELDTFFQNLKVRAFTLWVQIQLMYATILNNLLIHKI
jgi:hypothetical protein